jgi:hypothetical protein
MSAQSVLHDTQSRHGQSVLRKRYRYASAVGKLAFVSIGSLCSLFPLPCVQGFLSGVHFGVPQGFRLGSAAIARRPLSLHSLTCPARKGLLHAQVLGGVIGAKSTRVGTSRPAGLLQRHLSMSAGGADAEKLTVAQVEAMTVPQVKKALRVRGLSDRGKAAELRQLLVEACAAQGELGGGAGLASLETKPGSGQQSTAGVAWQAGASIPQPPELDVMDVEEMSKTHELQAALKKRGLDSEGEFLELQDRLIAAVLQEEEAYEAAIEGEFKRAKSALAGGAGGSATKKRTSTRMEGAQEESLARGRGGDEDEEGWEEGAGAWAYVEVEDVGRMDLEDVKEALDERFRV